MERSKNRKGASEPDGNSPHGDASGSGDGSRDETYWKIGLENLGVLQRIVVRRLSEYADDVARRVGDQTVLEPLGWIEGYARLWSGVVDDLDDLARHRSTSELRPSERWVPRYRRTVAQGIDRLTIRLEVPRSAYCAGLPEGAGAPEKGVSLMTDGFSRPGQPSVLKPGRHFDFVPSFVDYAQRRTEIRFFQLPSSPPHSLQLGSYAAVIWAEETGQVACMVELDVIAGSS